MRQKKVKEIRRLLRKNNGSKSLERAIRKLWYKTPSKKRKSIIEILKITSSNETSQNITTI